MERWESKATFYLLKVDHVGFLTATKALSGCLLLVVSSILYKAGKGWFRRCLPLRSLTFTGHNMTRSDYMNARLAFLKITKSPADHLTPVEQRAVALVGLSKHLDH